jgi:competence protein ComEA
MSIKDYLSFTKRERTGIITLAIVLLIVAVIPHFFPKPHPPMENIPLAQLQKQSSYFDSSRHKHDSDQTRYGETDYRKAYYHNYYPARTYTNNYKKRYYTDSNYRKRDYPRDNYYRNNYGEGKSFVHNDERKIFRNYSERYAAYHRPRFASVDINTADTTAFIALPGIGSKLAGRIVSFREKLGGFDSIGQIRKIYGLQDSVFVRLVPYLRCDSVYAGKPLVTYNAFR